MKSKVIWLLFLTFPFPLISLGQEPQTLQRTTNRPFLDSFSLGVSFSYYAPRTNNVSDVFDALEDTAGLARGPRFNIFYVAGADLRYSIGERNDVGIEGEMSLAQTKLQNVKSIERVYTIGAQYYYHLQPRRPGYYGVDVGGGVGWLVTNFERDYGDASIAILKKSLLLNATAQWWASIAQHSYLELGARYLFVPNIKVDNPQTTIKMSSVVLSAGVSIDL